LALTRRRAMIIAPKTLLAHWDKELDVCGLGAQTQEYYGSSVPERCGNMSLCMA
jgi:hypothetical protein